MAVRKLYEEKILELIKDIPDEELAQVIYLIKKRNMTATRIAGSIYSDVQTSSDEFAGKYQEIY